MIARLREDWRRRTCQLLRIRALGQRQKRASGEGFIGGARWHLVGGILMAQGSAGISVPEFLTVSRLLSQAGAVPWFRSVLLELASRALHYRLDEPSVASVDLQSRRFDESPARSLPWIEGALGSSLTKGLCALARGLTEKLNRTHSMPNDVVQTGDSLGARALRLSGASDATSAKARVKKNAGSVLDLSDPNTYRRLEHVVRKVCPPAMDKDRDDFVQVVMMRLLSRARRLGDKDPGVCSSYLFRAAQSVVIDEIRKRKREVLSDNVEDHRPSAHAANTQNDELIVTSSPAAQLRSKKLANAIDDCLAKVAVDRRRAVALRLQGFSIGEIANQLGWKKKKAENMERRGRENLRDCLSLKGYEIQC